MKDLVKSLGILAFRLLGILMFVVGVLVVYNLLNVSQQVINGMIIIGIGLIIMAVDVGVG